MTELPQSVRPVRVVIVDDDARYAAALVELIELSDRFEVVGIADGVESGCEALLRTGAELGLIDVHMPGGGGTRVLQRLEDWPSRPLLILISAHSIAADVRDRDVLFVPKDELDVGRLWSLWEEHRC